MKRTDLEKMKGMALDERMKKGGTPERFARQAAEPRTRREQRELERAQGLVPFAVKLDGELVKQIQALATERAVTLSEVTADLLRRGLGQ